MDRWEVEEIVRKLAKKHGISDLCILETNDEIGFHMILPQDVISGWSVTPTGGISYSSFLVRVAEKIAEPYNWIVNVQYACAEDDPERIDAWCEVDKHLPKESINEGEIKKLIKEAAEVLSKVRKAVEKAKAEQEKIMKKIEEAEKRRIERFLADL